MNPKLAILIPTMVSREKYLNRLLATLNFQIDQLNAIGEVEILTCIDEGQQTTGAKRNWLVNNTSADYVCFHDDDDMPTDVYVKKQLEVAKSGADCGEFRGIYFINGVQGMPFYHSVKYSSWWQDDKAYYRSPNHLSCLRRDLILDIPYPDIYVGEDGKMSEVLFASGRMKKEYPINETLYFYFDRTK